MVHDNFRMGNLQVFSTRDAFSVPMRSIIVSSRKLVCAV